jgi:hypothetical protein
MVLPSGLTLPETTALVDEVLVLLWAAPVAESSSATTASEKIFRFMTDLL